MNNEVEIKDGPWGCFVAAFFMFIFAVGMWTILGYAHDSIGNFSKNFFSSDENESLVVSPDDPDCKVECDNGIQRITCSRGNVFIFMDNHGGCSKK